MAMKLEAGNVGRSDLYAILPEHIVTDDTLNARASQQSEEEIESLAQSMLEHGQQQPAIVRRIEGNRVQLVAGYGRRRAILRINERQPEQPLKLLCRVIECNDSEAFLKSIVENLDRAETTVVDDAHNQRRLREQYGWTDERIAEFYKRSVSHVRQLRKTLVLATPIQQAVAKGNLSLSAAVDLTELPEVERAAVVSQATNANGHVNGRAIRERVRQTGKLRARTLADLRGLLEMFTGEDSTEPERQLASAFVAYLAGSISNDQMTAYFAEAVA